MGVPVPKGKRHGKPVYAGQTFEVENFEGLGEMLDLLNSRTPGLDGGPAIREASAAKAAPKAKPKASEDDAKAVPKAKPKASK